MANNDDFDKAICSAPLQPNSATEPGYVKEEDDDESFCYTCDKDDYCLQYRRCYYGRKKF